MTIILSFLSFNTILSLALRKSHSLKDRKGKKTITAQVHPKKTALCRVQSVFKSRPCKRVPQGLEICQLEMALPTKVTQDAHKES